MLFLTISSLKLGSSKSFFVTRSNFISSLKCRARSGLPLMVKMTGKADSHQQQPTESLSLKYSRMCLAVPENPNHLDISHEIATMFQIPAVSLDDHDFIQSNHLYDNCLHITTYQYQSFLESYAISIQPLNNDNSKPNRKRVKRRNASTMQPFHIDFCPNLNSKLGKRLGKSSHPEGLLKAVAPSKLGDGNGNGAVVFDLTAGFGQDSIILAMGGASKVYMVERDPVVGVLLKDAMRRLELVSSLDNNPNDDDEGIKRAKILHDKLELHQGDGINFAKIVLSSSTEISKSSIPLPDVCYLDCMFPPRTKSSAVKKNMQILHGLLQTNTIPDDNHLEAIRNEEERALLEQALKLAKKRVVVKRPVNAAALGVGRNKNIAELRLPSYELKGSVNRFDIYVL